MKSLNELILKENNTWKTLNDWLRKSERVIEILPSNIENARDALLKTQVSTKSMLGTVIYKIGGMYVENKWLRILGSGHDEFKRDIISWNLCNDTENVSRLKGALLIADDVVGGFFAINQGGLSGDIGNVFYFAPDCLEWEDMGIDYWDFIHWAVSGDLETFYKSFQWRNWEIETANVSCEQGILVYPFIWAKGPEITERTRKVVPVEELWYLNFRN